MQQRRLRLGDILDDYCPRERRITNHAVVAMIDDAVKQTRCTTCDADHEYKEARVPPRRKADGSALSTEGADAGQLSRPVLANPVAGEAAPGGDIVAAEPESAEGPAPAETNGGTEDEAEPDDDGPVHRRLIRATLPRPEGQVPERREPDFTIRQPGGRGGREVDGNRGGQRHGQGRRMRTHGGSGGQAARFGGGRHGTGPSDMAGNRGGRQGGQGQGRGPRPGGQGRKRGR
jgi:hypothetical protein